MELGLFLYGFVIFPGVGLSLGAGDGVRDSAKEGVQVPEPSAIEGILQAIVDAMEARDAAEPDLPVWESNARLKAAEADLLALYRKNARGRTRVVAIEIETVDAPASPLSVEVA
jgi:hypothetical protein